MSRLGRPRRHSRLTGSTNADARVLAAAGAPHGTLVTAAAQTAGRGRQGRSWVAPAGQSLLLSIVLRRFDRLLPLRAGLAAADVSGPRALVKWPNDVLVEERKVAGVLAEAFPRERCAVLGIGFNVAVDPAALPPALHERAGTLGRSTEELEPVLAELLRALERRLGEPTGRVLSALRERDALYGRAVAWRDGRGTAAGIGEGGALIVRTDDGRRIALDAGEIHLLPG